MFSFELLTMSWLARLAVPGLAVALAACGSNGQSRAVPVAAPAAAAMNCQSQLGDLPAARAAEFTALRMAVEQGPLFGALAFGAVPSCAMALDGSQWQLDYRFADNATLSVTRDTSIEYSDITAHVQWPAGTDPRPLLQSTERASFVPAGCGIDWQKPAELSATTQIWRGDLCQCQARVQRDAAGRVVTIGLRSAC
jgi:hypothetical protein